MLPEVVRREIRFNAAPALQIGLAALLPFLPFLLQFHGSGASPAPRSSFFIAGGFVLLALLARWAYFVFAAVFVPLSVLSIHLVLRFGGQEPGWRLDQPDARVETFLESPASETLEYFQTQWWHSDTAMLVAGLACLLLLAWVFRTRPALSGAAKSAVAVALTAWLAVAAAARLETRLDEWPQYQLAYSALEAQARVSRLAARDEKIRHVQLPAKDCTQRYRKVVIVLGESVALRHMSAFGYRRPTTPFADRSHPALFEALAPTNQTRLSLAMLLTPVDADHFEDFFETPSLVSRLAACGYRTLWISNQGRVGRFDSMVTSIAHEADESVFLNGLSYKNVGLDGGIVAALAGRGAFRATQQATFIHLIGSHARYSQRYPRGFGFKDAAGTVGAYDNSILYTDSVLADLYRGFGPGGLLFIYVPDHGEVVTNTVFGHGFTPGYREEFDVPLMVWGGDAAAVQALRDALGGRRLNLESFDDVVSFLVGGEQPLRLSTSAIVSSVAAHNRIPYEALRPYDASQADQ